MGEDEIKEALAVFNELKGHIVWDNNVKDICYSAQFMKARRTMMELARKELGYE